MTDLTWLLGRAALAGAASGARSQTALAALSLTAGRGAHEQPDRILGRTGVKVTATLAAVTEGVLDKLPVTPSRLEPAGLLPRIAAGAACGVIISRRAPAAVPGPPAQHHGRLRPGRGGRRGGVRLAWLALARVRRPAARTGLARRPYRGCRGGDAGGGGRPGRLNSVPWVR